MVATTQTKRNPQNFPNKAPDTIERISGPGMANVCMLWINLNILTKYTKTQRNKIHDQSECLCIYVQLPRNSLIARVF